MVQGLQMQAIKSPANFLDFCMAMKEKIDMVSAKIAAHIPVEMYRNDNRMDIGKFSANEFARAFDDIEVDLSEGHDLAYTNGDTISLKFNSSYTFQRNTVRGIGTTKPGNIIIKNFRKVDENRILKSDDLNFDYLWVINYQRVPANLFYGEGISITFGVASKQTVIEYIVEQSITDHQLLTKIPDAGWGYHSGGEFITIKIDNGLNSCNYKKAENYMYDLLMGRI